MIAALVILLELALGCHCARFVDTAGGLRCAVVVQRCELVEGWHHAAPFVPVCSRDCGPDVRPRGSSS